MSEKQVKLSWGTAAAEAEEKAIFPFPEGTTRITILTQEMPERSQFENKYIIKCLIDEQPRKISLGGKHIIKINKNLNETNVFDVTRIGADKETRYLVTPIKGNKKK